MKGRCLLNVLSLFDGMSCGRIALERAGIEVDNYYASEIKEEAIQVTQENYPSTIQLGDVKKIRGSDFKDIDLLIAGFPCQNISQAMKKEHRHGLKGDKSILFFEFYRILKEANPKFFLLENVSGMTKEDRETIDDLLGVEAIRINSKLVSGQLRDRLYWTNIPEIVQPKNKMIQLNSVLTEGWSDREKARCLLESDSRPLTTSVKMFHRYYGRGFQTLIFENEEHYLRCKEHYNKNFKSKLAKEVDGYEGDLSVYDGVRYLNQVEMEILQTVPVGYTSSLTRDQAAGLLGDGWTVDVIAHILKNIK